MMAVTGPTARPPLPLGSVQSLSQLGHRCLAGTLGVGIPRPWCGHRPDHALIRSPCRVRRVPSDGATYAAIEASNIGIVEHLGRHPHRSGPVHQLRPTTSTTTTAAWGLLGGQGAAVWLGGLKAAIGQRG